MYRAIGRIFLFTAISAVIAFFASSLTEIVLLAITFRSLYLHNVDATSLQPYLISIFIIFTLIIDYFLIKKFFIKSLS